MKAKTGVYVVFKGNVNSKCQNKLFFWKHLFFVFITETFDGIFDAIIDDPYLTNWMHQCGWWVCLCGHSAVTSPVWVQPAGLSCHRLCTFLL